MKILSLKLDQPVYEETDRIVHSLHKSRNRYINEAISFYNYLHKRRILSEKLKRESLKVKAESMKVLAEFDRLNENDQAI